VKRSLGHRDKDAAKAYADEQASKLRQGVDDIRAARPSADRVFRLYQAHKTRDKSAKMQKEDERQIALWKNVLGSGFDLSKLSRREWDAFIRHRRSGEIDGRGNPVPDEDERRKVGARVVGKDLTFLRTVCRWACDFRDNGRLLLERDATRGYDTPAEKNPERPVATHDRVDAIRGKYRQVTMRIERGAKRETVESWLPELFELAVGTGRRITAICSLRVEDLELDRTKGAPHGAIVWPSDTDKMRRRWRCPISPDVRDAIDNALRKRQRLGHVGAGWLFPSPIDPGKAVRYEQARKWLREAERVAKLEPLRGGVWHPYRRLWASARKGLPDIDVMQAGGWSSSQSLKAAYQHPDDATMLRVVTHQAELREVK
jgi:integrase